MTPERYQQIDQIFQAALGLEPEPRAAYLDEVCSGDDKLRQEVDSLITSDEGGLSFIDEPAFEMAARVLASDEPALAVGDHIDRYEVISLLGSGGMGEVYLAHDEKLDRKIALKLLPAHFTTNEERLRRFQQEARAASALNHPNIITIHEIGQVENRNFIATEFVDGETLRQRIKREPLILNESLDIATQVAGALAAAHKAGIVHRDIKPENIMLRHDGYVKVLDFGLAKLTEEHKPTTQVQAAENVNVSSGLLMGTVKYMSPEQAQGLQVDARSDVFSFGVVLYEMLAGRAPFEGKTANELIAAILEKEPPLANLPDGIRYLISKALRKKKEERYQTIADLMTDLKGLRQQLETQVRSVSDPRDKKTVNSFPGIEEANASAKLASSSARELKKNRKLIATLSVASLTLIALAMTGLWLRPNRANGVTTAAVGSIAVMPFKLVDEEDRDHLGVGMADLLITRLGAFRQINVRPTSAILRYQEQEADPASVGREQQVDAVLHGRIRKIGERWHIAVQLTEARDGSLLWKAEFDEDSSRLYAVEGPIAQGLAQALRVNLGANEKQQFAKHYTENAEAHRLYIEGRHYWNKRDQEGCRKAIMRFQQATDIDPTYALAWTGLADTYAFLGSAYFDPVPPREDMEKARAAAARALEFDDTLAEAHCAMATIKAWYEFDWKGAEEELKRALELNPHYATAHQNHAWWFLAMARMDEALAEIKQAQLSDPLSPPINSNIGAFLYFQRRYDESLAQFQKMFERDPTFSWNHTWIGWVYLEKGDFERAIEEFKYEKSPYEEGRWGLAVAYARTGRTDEARRILNRFYQLARERYVSPSAFILIHIALGEKEKAFDWLEKAYEARDFDLSEIKVDPKLDPLRSDRRFADLLQRIGVN
ncbi:MAG: hypothetical protein DMF74_19365 [Acidobacteria bacterium]|nr:MAG: hypothetical protein DMF74_19365 [Acidobacteriota bacterium]